MKKWIFFNIVILAFSCSMSNNELQKINEIEVILDAENPNFRLIVSIENFEKGFSFKKYDKLKIELCGENYIVNLSDTIANSKVSHLGYYESEDEFNCSWNKKRGEFLEELIFKVKYLALLDNLGNGREVNLDTLNIVLFGQDSIYNLVKIGDKFYSKKESNNTIPLK